MQIIGAPAGVKSIQRGNLLLPQGLSNKAVAIAPVNLSRSVLHVSCRTGVPNASSLDLSALTFSGSLTSGSEINLVAGGSVGQNVFDWTVIEYA